MDSLALGIERRHFAAEGQMTSDLACKAAEAALAQAGMTADDIDAIVVATSTPDLTFPSVATMVQGRLGMTKGFAFDVQAVCAGFVFALSNANALIVSGQAKRALVIGAETFSRLMDWTIAAPVCCSATAPARWFLRPSKARETMRIAASSPPT